jgi:acetyltransferase-like isoleucine patch superfamily enzyme
MKFNLEIKHDQYSDVEYRMFYPKFTLQVFQIFIKLLIFPLVLPFIILAKLSTTLFRFISELFSIIPFGIGEIVRYDFYKFTLRHCGNNVFISFGTIFYYANIYIGDNVLIGMYNTIHHCDFGNDVMTAEGCRFLSGSKYHNFDRMDIPMTRQGGKLKRIKVGNDVWIGTNAIIMEDIGEGSIIGAGSVVTRKMENHSIAVGNPATVIKKRTIESSEDSGSE